MRKEDHTLQDDDDLVVVTKGLAPSRNVATMTLRNGLAATVEPPFFTTVDGLGKYRTKNKCII